MAKATRGKLNARELAAFFESMAMLLQAGVPVNECPSIIAADVEKGVLAAAAAGVDRLLNSEVFLLSEALEKSAAFPEYAVEMARLGEESGRLENAMLSLGGYYHQQDELNQSIRSSISGPLLLLFIMGAVLFFLIAFALPVFENVFASLGLASGSGVAGAFMAARVAMLIVAVLLLFVIGLVVVYLAPGGRQRISRLVQWFPATSKVHYWLSASRLTYALEMLMSSGIPHANAVEKAAALVDNNKICSRLPACQRAVEEGKDLGRALVEECVLDGFEAKVLISAAKAGQSENAMKKLSQTYSMQATDGINRMLGMLEPALVGILSVAIGVILLSVMLPLTSIISTIG